MPTFKIKNSTTGHYLDYNATTLTALRTSPSDTSHPSITVESNNNSISQVWYSDSMYGQAYISPCLDRNFCITRYELTTTHQCALTVEKYYDYFTSCFDPKIEYVAAGSSGYRIRLVGSNMYLTEITLSNGSTIASWGALNDNLYQFWKFEVTTTYPIHTLEIYQNLNQCWIGHPEAFQEDGCAASSAANASSYYGKYKFDYEQIEAHNGFTAEKGVLWGGYVNCTFGSNDTSPTYAKIKQSIDSSKPIIIRMQGPTKKHYVMVYGYKGTCSSADDVFVLDSGNTSNTSQDLGLFFTLNESFTWNSCNSMLFLVETSPKASQTT